jgi:iron complex transport system substrate-binding protein
MRRSLYVLLVVLAMLATACGFDGSEAQAPAPGAPTTARPTSTTEPAASSTTATTVAAATTTAAPADFPVTVVGDNGDVVVAQRPVAIVSLSPTATEMLFAIGAGSQIVAADSLSNYPADAPATPLSAFAPNVEAISEFNPDLVVLSFDPGDVVASLETIGIPALVQGAAASIEDTYEQMRQLGAAAGVAEGAEEAVAAMEGAIAGIVASIPEVDEPISYYHELDDTYYSVASSTFIGAVYGLLGMVSIADEAADLNFGYPQLSAEFILEADPDLILLADIKCCNQDAAAVAARAGWGTLSAVKDGAIVELDDDIASRWGPRIVDLLVDVSSALIELGEAA